MPVADPFAEVEATPEEISKVSELKSAIVPHGSLFVFDLETVPDESRFPRPVAVEKIKRPDREDISVVRLVESTVPGIKTAIPTLSESQLNLLMEYEQKSKKPRSGVIDAIDAQIAADNADDHAAAMLEWKKYSFNPFACRIVALGIEANNHSVTMLAKNDDEERELLRVLWEHINKFRVRCGYNITGFDDAVLIMRSMLLGVDASHPISRKKFGDKGSIDLMTALFPAGQAQKLKEVCKMLGIVPLAGYEMSGDKVFDLVESGDWDGIAKYVHSDAVIEFELYRRLSDYMIF